MEKAQKNLMMNCLRLIQTNNNERQSNPIP
jgi:hypothetical protein